MCNIKRHLLVLLFIVVEEEVVYTYAGGTLSC
jgi:hypothetical protein